MDTKTLEALGISTEVLGDRIVEQCVRALLTSKCFDQDGNQELDQESRFKREIDARIQTAVDEKISAIAAAHIIPRIAELIEAADMRKTSVYGEPKGPSLTFKEYIASRADAYMSEEVDLNGKSKTESDSYNWRSHGPRLTVLMRIHIRETLEECAKKALADVNSAIVKNIEKAARDAINRAAAAVKINVSA